MNPLTKMSINKHLILLFIILLAPVFLSNWYSNEKGKDILTDQVTTAFIELIKQNRILIDQDIHTIKQVTTTLILNPTTQQITSDSDGDLELVRHYTQLNENLKRYSIIGGDPVLYSIFVMDTDNRYSFTPSYQSVNSGAFFIKEEEKPDWYDEALMKKGQGFLKIIDDFGVDQKKTLAYIRAVNNVNQGNEAIGVLVVTSMDDLIQRSLRTVSVPEGEILFMDTNNTIYTGTESEIGTIFSIPMNDQGDKSPHEPFYAIQDEFIYVVDSHFGREHRLVYKIPLSTLTQQQTELTRTTQTFMIIYFVFCFVVVLYFMRSFIHPLQKMASFFKFYEPGEILPVKPDVNRKDEVGILILSVYGMTHRLKKLISDKYEMEIKQKESQLQMLYEQINPHLLYNTLESIHWKSSLNGDAETAGMIKDLSSLMKIGLSRGRDLIQIREELEHAKAYTGLQQKRYDYNFQVKWEIEEKALSAIIPKIILQPIIENAMIHGVRNMGEDGKINISSSIIGEELYIYVEDNGFKKPDIVMIRKLLSTVDGDPTIGYGISNVHQRIQMHFGNEYGLHYDYGNIQGTKVTIKLPYKVEKDV